MKLTSSLCKSFGITASGILHLGAHLGQEVPDYQLLKPRRIALVEALPDKCRQARELWAAHANVKIIEACMDEVTGRTADFYVASNASESSSILPMKLHRQMHPEVKVVDTWKMATTSLPDLFAQHGLNPADFDLLVLDLQGAELQVLRGGLPVLGGFRTIKSEVSSQELYAGSGLVADVDALLAGAGLKRRMLSMTPWCWGDALYTRQ